LVQHKRLAGWDVAFATGFGDAGVPDFRVDLEGRRDESGVVLEPWDSKASKSTTGVGVTGP
jgi:hypothetical protein